MTCPKCGEDNADNFRFCGMCGTLLEPPRRMTAPISEPRPPIAPPPAPISQPPVSQAPISHPPISRPISQPNPANVPAVAPRPVVAERAPVAPARHVPPISGPSMLGLNQTVPESASSIRQASREPAVRESVVRENVVRESIVRDDRSASSPIPTVVIPTVANPSFDERNPNQPSPADHTQYQPSMDSLRERAFSGLDSFLEPEEPKTGGRRIFLMILLVAALGGAAWWIYANYLGAGENRKTETTASSASETPTDAPSQPETQAQSKTTAPNAGASQATAPSSSSSVPEGPSENAGPTPETTGNAADESPEKPAVVAKAPAAPVAAPISKRDARREAQLAHPKVAKPPAPEPEDTGDAAFRKGEAYLYGRGAPENCDEAVKNLKAASAKSNAKARSAFGTMYATGHCVPRDLPTSYTWFALALRADPNNQILEKDLTAIWNQMTPPERQLATRMKQ